LKLKRKVNFDICTFCNHKCTFCSNSDERTLKDQVTLEDFKAVMNNITKYVDIDELGLSAKGEVLVNKEFVEIVKSCKDDFNIGYIYFSTNGALLDNKKAIELLEAGINSIKFSINALDEKSYVDVHQTDDFDKVIRNFQNLLHLKKTKYKDLKVTISSVIDMDKEKLSQKFKKLIGDNFELIDDIAVYAISYTPKMKSIGSDKKITKKCPIPFSDIYINSDSTLGFCCKDYFDEISFGSLLKNDFLELYNSKEYEDIREMHKKSEFPDNHLCKNCLLFGNDNV